MIINKFARIKMEISKKWNYLTNSNPFFFFRLQFMKKQFTGIVILPLNCLYI